MAPEASRPRRHHWLLLVAGVLLPLLAVLWLMGGVRHHGVFAFDLPVLLAVHSIANARLDRVFAAIAAIGYGYGVIPAEALLVAGLALARHRRAAVFASVAIVGSLLIEAALKHAVARPRPSLWASPFHEASYSFPSAHAMASMTLAWLVVLLCWSTPSSTTRRMRGWIAVAAAAGVALVGLSRIYLGVHYPSDVLAGWAAASTWVVGLYLLTSFGR